MLFLLLLSIIIMFNIPFTLASNFWKSNDDYTSDDDEPAYKRLRKLSNTRFPLAAQHDMWKKQSENNVRYIPIQVESGHPSTSTPNKVSDKIRTVPIKLLNVNDNGATLSRKPRMHTPVKPVLHAVTDDEDDDEITLIENQPENKAPRIYIEDDEEDQQDDVIFVSKVKPPSSKSYRYFVSKNNRDDGQPIQSFNLYRKLSDRTADISPKTYNRFKSPPGITKPYKKVPVPVPKWMQTPKPMNLLQTKARTNINGNTRSTLSAIFNLNEKRNYQELIRRVSGTGNVVSSKKPLDIGAMIEDAVSFRNTQRMQKKSLNEIAAIEKDLNAEKVSVLTKEYDPITVASINSSDSEVELVPSESSTSSVKIDPLNSLRDSYKDKAITSDDWLRNLDLKYKIKKQANQAKVQDARRESDLISRVNYEQRIAHLESKLKHELSIPESLIEEAPEVLVLPPLTPEQEKLVNKAMGPGPSNQVLIEKFNLRITRNDIRTLSGLNWLNDEVINFYMNLLMQRCEEKKDLPKVYATNTFFYPKLMQSGQAGLRRWTRKVDVFAHELMVVPVHLGVHWCVSLIDFREKKINYLDSMGGRNQQCLNALLQYLRDEHADKKGQPFDDEDWETESLMDIPQQMNGSDCGVFSCTFAEFAARGAPFNFSQQHMPYLRRKAALEILQGRLLF